MADKCASFLQWLHSLSVVVTIVCIQEAHCTSLAECDSWSRSSGFLSQDQADLCEGCLSVEECQEALMGMARNKAPGSDSLPM